MRCAHQQLFHADINFKPYAPEQGCKYVPIIDIFLTSREVEKSLARKETAKCLAWCHDNKSKLRRLKSNMEFNIRIQEFVELVRADKRMDAVKHSRKHFPIFQDEHLDRIREVMGLLAVHTSTRKLLSFYILKE